MKAWVAAAWMLAMTTGALAAEPAATFRFGGLEFSVPLPEGYCLPAPEDGESDRLLAAADRENVTHLSIDPCELPPGILTDYYLIKTPRAVLHVDLDREQFLAEVAEATETAEFNAELSSMNDEVEESLAETFGRQFELAGEFRALGRDETCMFLGGTMQVTTGTNSYPISVGACMTVVSRRMLSIYRYGPDRGSAGVAELLTEAKRLAQAITAQPAP